MTRHCEHWNPSGWVYGLLVFSVVFSVAALDPAKSVFQYNCRSWTRQNGLPANGVNAVVQTRDGYLWLGTAQGLVRFDGVEFKLVDLPKSPGFWTANISCLSKSQSGGLWFGLNRNAFGFYNDKGTSFLGRPDWGRVNLNVKSLLETKDGALWISSEHLAARLVGRTNFTAILGATTDVSFYDVTSLLQDSRGDVWLGTASRGIYRWHAGTLVKMSDATLDQRIVFCMVEDLERNLWLGTESGLICCDSNLVSRPAAVLTAEIRTLLVDRHGVLWIGTSGSGLVRRNHGKDEAFQRKDGLADDYVTALAEDQEGSIWAGTRDGLNQFTDVKFPTYSTTEGILGSEVLSVSDSQKGGVWVTTSSGLTYFEGTRATNYSVDAGLANPYIKRSFEARNGDLYLINGNKDVEIFRDGKVVSRHSNPTWPVAMTEDAQGVVVSVAGDLFRASRDSFAPYRFSNSQKPVLKWVLNLVTGHDGSIWVAGANGICRVKDGRFEQWTGQNGLSDSRVNTICEDRDGVIWAGMRSGIARLRNNQIRNISHDDGLLDDSIQAMVLDDHDFLWVDSSRGLFRVSLQSLNDFVDGKTGHVTCIAYNQPEAVRPADRNVQENSGCRTPDGRIWFPSSKGLVMIDPANIPTNKVAVQVHIYRVCANGRVLAAGPSAQVPPGRGDLEFYYTAPSFISPPDVQFRYWLEGYDPGPVHAGNRRLALYTNLKPGKYTFHVSAANADGIWSEAGDAIEISLRPHFYQTIWFYTSCGVAGLGAVFGGYVWRVGRYRRKQEVLQQARDQLETEVRNRTEELAQSNDSLKREVEEHKRTEVELEHKTQSLEKEIDERKRMELEVEQTHRQLIDASRVAGQAEVASSVLHNVGNVLNSVNVSTTLVSSRLGKLQVANLVKATQLLREHADADDLGHFLTADEKGNQLPGYLELLAKHLSQEQKDILGELKELGQNVEHIKEIVAMQQTYAKISGAVEKVEAAELVESALKMLVAAFRRHSVKIVQEYETVPAIAVDRHKVLQILINIFQNAKYACSAGGLTDKTVAVRIRQRGAERVSLEITDNGIGIAPENLTRIFSHGFTTRKDGHGFGLHSSALAARQMGGTLTAQSQGMGRGATFILELPLSPPAKKTEAAYDKPIPPILLEPESL